MANQWLISATSPDSAVAQIARPWWDALRRRIFALAVPIVVVADAWLCHLGFQLAYVLRFAWHPVFPVVKGVPPWHPYAVTAWLLAIVWVLSMAFWGMYRDRRGVGHLQDIALQSLALGSGVFIAVGAGFFYRGFSFSRLLLVYAAAIAWVTLGLWHGLVRTAHREMLKRGWGALNVLIVGCNSLSETLGTRLHRHPELGRRLVGFVPADGERVAGERWHFPAWTRQEGDRAGSSPILGSTDDLAEIVGRLRIDEVVLAIPGASFKDLFGLMGLASYSGWPVQFRIVPDLTELVTAKLKIGELDGVPTMEIWDVPLRKRQNRVLKRTFDILLSAVGMIALAPVMLAIGLLVSAGGPIFYRQERMGRDGRTFQLVKFRTMRIDAEDASGPVWAQPGDRRVTRVGAFLRRWSLDELPQLWNVFVGDMSLVGPRPERPHFVDQFRHHVPKYMDRHLVRSGLTGWAQINGLRGEEGSIEERTRYDIYYVENWSLLFDIEIMLRTLIEVVVHKAY